MKEVIICSLHIKQTFKGGRGTQNVTPFLPFLWVGSGKVGRGGGGR